MPSLKHAIVEIHRRSLWQVLAVYLGTAWVMMEVVDHVIERYLLPEWVYGAAIVLLAIGLPVVLATAFVREETSTDRAPDPPPLRDPTLLQLSDPVPAGENPDHPQPPFFLRALTWPRAILGGVLAFTVLALISGFMVWKGLPRISEARGEAGDAFDERAWVVVADFETAPSETEVAGAARTALTIDLQQSRYVNVYGREQMRPVLRRMGLPDTAQVDRRLALEIAEREGLAAVLAPELSRAGADYVFGARVLEPGTGRELVAVRSAARENRLLEGIEALSREVRSRLGEAADEIRRSRPLPEVTTRSLEALKLYARADEVHLVRDEPDEAAELAHEAVRLDSTFAMAHRLLAVIRWNQGRAGPAIEHSARAQALQDRLTERERLHVQAFHAQLLMNPRRAADVYERILERYPDDARAANNLGVMTGVFLGEYDRSYRAYRRALESNPYGGLTFGNAVDAAIVTGRLAAADSLLAVAADRELGEGLFPFALGLRFGMGDLDRADALCDSVIATTRELRRAEANTLCGSIDFARGRLRRGVDRLERVNRYHAEHGAYGRLHQTLLALLAAEHLRGRPDALESHVRALLTDARVDSMAELDRWIMRTAPAVGTALAGRIELTDEIEAAYPLSTDTPDWARQYSEGFIGAARALANGDESAALAHLDDAESTGYRIAPWDAYQHLIRGLAFEGLGQIDSAIAELEAAISPSWTSIYWQPGSRVWLPFVLRRLGDLEEERGNRAAAASHYRRLLELRSDPDPELRDELAAVRRSLDRLGISETR